ncbi:MAG: AAA family ATPase [Gaiellaceae bacterium]
MASEAERLSGFQQSERSSELAGQWRRLTRAATLVALLTAPAVVVWLNQTEGWSWFWSIVAALFLVVCFRGLVDLVFHRLIPRPSLFGLESQQLREEDVVARRRVWFWRFWVKAALWSAVIVLPFYLFLDAALLVQIVPLLVILPVFLVFNFVILFGPLLLMNLSQIQAFEPGDAEWGVKLADVRGQVEAKEEVRRVVAIWQSGEAFERAGGKRERGLLFLGAPGTGKTMLAKALATGFNSPFISIPGSGFAATFIGIDAIVVRILARRAKRLARKWGGQCIVFIDEIDAVGMRRNVLNPGFGGGGVGGGHSPVDVHELLWYGPFGALNPSGDLILENHRWRERLFAERAPQTPGRSGIYARAGDLVNFIFPGGMGGGGSLALNQLLVVMDGIDNPPFFKKLITNKVNTLLDGVYVVPRRIRGASLRLPAARPRREQIYFIGATNVPVDRLDPALTRPGRMGRHVWFRTPTKQDRLDILDLYLGKVSHSAELDQARRREELARVTNGYSPAMLEQVTSMALTIAHHSQREALEWDDLVEAMTTLEAGTAVGVEYVPEESRAVAIHEAGHAAAGHVYLKGAESTRLSIRMRGGALGHHQALEKEERFSRFRSEEFARLVWALGAMAAERVFYGENSNGVGGDVMSVTAQAAYMVGASAMGPQPFEISPREDESEEEARERVLKRFEKIGLQIVNRTSGGGPFSENPIASVLGDRDKRAIVGQLLGQAYVAAHNLVLANREAVEQIADVLTARRELFGDELLELLESSKLTIPEVDLSEESSWPAM